jgi:uncharacterized damage-inducible protein DinB
LCRPESDEFAPFYGKYIDLVPHGELLALLRQQVTDMQTVFENVSPEASLKLHAPYTWSLRQVMGHMCDAERIFGYRATRFLVGDATELPGYEENSFVDNAHFNDIDLPALLSEWRALREANLCLFSRANPENGTFVGVASGVGVTPRALAYIIAGHVIHHLTIVRRRLQLP